MCVKLQNSICIEIIEGRDIGDIKCSCGGRVFMGISPI